MDEDYGDVISAAMPTPAPKLTRTVRGAEKLKGVQPDLVNHWNKLQDEFSKAGLSPAIKSGFRTAEQQNSLHRRGYPTKGNDGYVNISPHQEGRALDISFSAAQKPKGREIIAAYAKANGLHVPSDEPWHLAIPKALKAQQDDYADVIGAAVPRAKTESTATADSYDEVVAAAAPKGKQPSITTALDKLTADVTNRTSNIKAPRPAHEGQPRASTVNLSSDELRVMKGEQPVDRQAYSRQQDAQARLSRMRDESYRERQAREAKDIAWRKANQPEIDRQTELYKQDIRKSGGNAVRWLTELGKKGAGQMLEVWPGDTARIHSEAAIRAAEEEGASRSQLSKGIQNIGAGFIGSAPELGAMALGIPAPAVFAGGGAIRSKSSDPLEVANVAEHGGATGLAYEIPGVGEGVKKVLSGSAATGLGTAAIDLASGATPKEALISGATNALMRGVPEAARMLKHGVPERPETISAQLEQRGYSLVPEGTPKPSIPRGFRTEKTQDGVVYFDPKRISREEIRNTPTQELLGHLEPKSESTTETVVARTPEGTEIQSSAVSPENVEKQAEVMQEQYPAAKIETGGNDLAEKVIAERVEPQRFQHLQFGEVEALPDQVGAGNGRLKVAEVANPEKVHYVKKADLRGRGNERMVPLKTEPQNISTAPPLKPETAAENAARIEDAKSQLSELSQKRGETIETPVAPNKSIDAADTSVEGLGATSPSTTAAKKASMAADRAELDLPELPPAERRSWQESLDKAKEKGTQNAGVLADEVLKRPRALNDTETAQLVLRAQEVKNEHSRVMKEIGAAKDIETIQAKRAEAEALEGEFDKLTQATKASGTEKGRNLASQKLTINQDFDLVSMVQRAKAARGRELRPEERAKIETQAKQIEELTAKLAEAEDRVKATSLQKEIDKVVRRGRRAETKATLDDEFADLRAQFAQARAEAPRVQASGLAGLDPEGKLTVLIGKMARNRVKAGTVQAEALVDEIYSAIKEHVEGVTPRDVRDVISGYGIESKGRNQSEDAVRLGTIRSELKRLSVKEDIEAGKRLSPADKSRQTQLLKQEAELQRRIDQRDFSPTPKREAPVYSRETQKIQDRVQKIKSEYQAELERQSPWYWLKNLSGIRKAGMLSGYLTHVRNIAGTGGYIGFDEVRRLPSVVADAALSSVTGVRTTTLSPSAMLDGVLQAVKVGGREAKEILKHGAPKEQLEKQQLQEINTGVKAIDKTFNLVFRAMSASDRVFYQGAFKRNLVERAQAQAKTEARTNKSLDWRTRAKELTENPSKEMDADAKHDALVATFNNNNRLSDAIKRGRGALGAGGNFALDLVLPFDRTPTNVIARVIEASPAGYFKNAGQAAKAFWNRSFTPAEQRAFVETFGRATTGTALTALGFALAAKGLLTTDDYGTTYLEVRGRKINLSAIAPLGTLLSVGAGLQKQHAKEDSTKRSYAGAVLKPLADQPLLKSSSQVSDLVKDPNRSAGKFVAGLASSFIPMSGAVRTVGEAIDPAQKRYPDSSFSEQFKRNVPKLRESLPASRVRLLGSEVNKATQEAERLGVTIKGAVKQPDETSEEFQKRQAVQNGNIKVLMENVIALPDYDNASDEDKTKWLKQASEYASKETLESLPEKPEKKEEKQFPMPSASVGFESTYPADGLAKYERMSEAQRVKVRDSMAQKAWILTHSTALSDEEKAAYKERLDKLGITPRPAGERPRTTTLRQQLMAQ
jgi:hypothetical protein